MKSFSNIYNKVKLLIYENLVKPKENNIFGYKAYLDRKEFSVYKRPLKGMRIETAFNHTVVLTDGLKRNKITIIPDDRYPRIKYSVLFNENNFPGLIEDSEIEYCRVIPYLRKIDKDTIFKAWRLIIVTNHAQIFHNFPATEQDIDGQQIPGHIICFEESVVWDLEERRFPSQEKTSDSKKIYYPGLKKEAYEYHPAVNVKSKYGNNGFPEYREVNEVKFSRFYIPNRSKLANPFAYMSGISCDYKMSVIGTYRPNISVGVRTCIFASSDGGREWYCKYEFGDMGDYTFTQGSKPWGENFGSRINLSCKTNDKLLIKKRKNIIPCDTDKDPLEKFAWDGEALFYVEDTNNMIFISERNHNLTTGNIVTIIDAPTEMSWMINKNVNSVSVGNGLLFKINVIDNRRISLYEYVSSPYNPIACRHIHHINRVRDGWLIGTGEIYPNSWILYMQMKEADTYSEKNASDEFEIFRLNSSEKSVQRTLGVIWDETSNDIIYASDHDVLESKEKQILFNDRQLELSRGATGVYRGSLNCIDSYNSFKIIFEAKEPAYFFQQLDGCFVFSGQRGELALSFDKGESWSEARLDGPLNHPKGFTSNYYIFDDYILRLK